MAILWIKTNVKKLLMAAILEGSHTFVGFSSMNHQVLTNLKKGRENIPYVSGGAGGEKSDIVEYTQSFLHNESLLSKERTKALFQLWEMYPQLQHSPASLSHLRGLKAGSYVTGGKLRKEGNSPETQTHYKAENLIISL